MVVAVVAARRAMAREDTGTSSTTIAFAWLMHKMISGGSFTRAYRRAPQSASERHAQATPRQRQGRKGREMRGAGAGVVDKRRPGGSVEWGAEDAAAKRENKKKTAQAGRAGAHHHTGRGGLLLLLTLRNLPGRQWLAWRSA